MPLPFWAGKAARCVFFQQNDQVIIDIMSWTVKPSVVKAADGVCGEDRDRLQTILNSFDISLDTKQQKLAGLIALLENQENQDQNLLALEHSLGFIIKPYDGTQAGFQALGVCVDDWEFSVGGRTERNKLSIPLRATHFKQIPTI